LFESKLASVVRVCAVEGMAAAAQNMKTMENNLNNPDRFTLLLSVQVGVMEFLLAKNCNYRG
jgi:hypothetical protein